MDLAFIHTAGLGPQTTRFPVEILLFFCFKKNNQRSLEENIGSLQAHSAPWLRNHIFMIPLREAIAGQTPVVFRRDVASIRRHIPEMT